MNVIYLVGMMGSGKSTISALFSKNYGYQVVDLDDLIEQSTGTAISELFMNKGETYFRELETAILKAIDLNRNTIISTGGGTFCDRENIEYINNTGISFYLKAPIGKLIHRIKNSTKERPLIKEAIENNRLEERMSEILEMREPFYQKAHHILDTKDTSNKEIVEKIMKLM